MPQLLHDKIAELQTLATQASEKIAKASETLADANTQSMEKLKTATLQEFQTANKASQNELKTQIAETLTQVSEKNKEQINRELAAAKTSFREEFGQQLASDLAQSVKSIETKTLEQLKATLPPQLTENLKADESLQESLAQHAKAAAREVASAQDFAAMIDHSKIPTEPIANALKNDKTLQESLKQSAKQGAKNYLESPAGSEGVKEILHTKAKEVYREAMREDELLRERYESALRLECLKIYGTQELVEEIIKASTRAYTESLKPESAPDPVKNNILVVG